MEIYYLEEVLQTPRGQRLSDGEAGLVRLYGDLKNFTEGYLSLNAKKAGGYLTEEGSVNYDKFEDKLRRYAENRNKYGFVAYEDGKPAGLIVFGPSNYPDNEFAEFVDVKELSTIAYPMPGNSFQIEEMLFAEDLSNENAKRFFAESLAGSFEFARRRNGTDMEGLIMEADQKNLVLIGILHELGFEGRGSTAREVGVKYYTDRWQPDGPHYDFTQYRENELILYADLADVFRKVYRGIEDENVVIHPMAKTETAHQDQLPPPPSVVHTKDLR